MANFEEAKQYLKKTSSGTNLYDHLSTLILKVVQDKPDDPLALFEEISTSVKKSTFVGSNQIEGERLPGEDAEVVGEDVVRALVVCHVKGVAFDKVRYILRNFRKSCAAKHDTSVPRVVHRVLPGVT